MPLLPGTGLARADAVLDGEAASRGIGEAIGWGWSALIVAVIWAIIAAILSVLFHVFAALPPHRNVGPPALIIGAGYGLLLLIITLASKGKKAAATTG